MSLPDAWGRRPPPSPPPRPPGAPPLRYPPRWIWLGVAVGTFGTPALQGLGLGAGALVGGVVYLLFWVGTFGLLVVGIALTTKGRSTEIRAMGLGMIIGWALAPIVFAGSCVLYIVTFHPHFRIAG